MSDTLISVVIPTRGRESRLQMALAALADQTLGRDRFEVIVVRDADAPQRVAEGLGLDLRELRLDCVAGPAPKRNLGWRAARAPLVAFTDDDCTPTPGWLEALLRAAGPELVVQGPTLPDPRGPDRLGPFAHTRMIGAPDGLYATCNIAYPRSLLERVGGFDESFERACGEDVDLGWRTKLAGAGYRFADEALVHHDVTEPSLADDLRSTVRWTDAVRIARDYPSTRRLMRWRLFWRPAHPWAILLLLGGADAAADGRIARLLRSRALAAAVTAVPWAAHHLRHEPLPGAGPVPPSRLPRRLLTDLVEIATMVAGSIRHRSPML